LQKLQPMDERPLYQQLRDIIRADILSGRYPHSQRIPTEMELARLYGVSRNTVRSAIGALQKESLLVRKQGKGTFVGPPKMNRPLGKSQRTRSFTDMCREMGCRPGAKVILSRMEVPTEQTRKLLELGEDEQVVTLGRVRSTDDLPVSVEYSRFHPRFSFLLDEQLDDCSMFSLLETKYGVHFSTASMSLELVFACYELAQHLGLEEGYPLLFLESVLCDPDGRPACHNEQYIVGNRFKMVLY
jgi:GntR family transcriptional regulator